MAKLTQAAKVGAFVIAMSGAGYLVYRTVSKEVGSSGGYTVHGYLDDASGLAPHSRVLMAGIPVGSIEKISLENGKARLDIKVSKDITLNQSAKMGIKSASLLGENVIVLSPGVGEPRKKDGDLVETLSEGRSIESLKDQVGRIADLVEKVAQQLAGSIGTDQGREQIKAILKNLAEATEAINLTVRENRTALKETIQNIDNITRAGSPEIQRILENVRVITEDIKVMLAKNGGPDGQSGELRGTISLRPGS